MIGARSHRHRSGRYIVVAGPDGTGKSTVAEHLRDTVLAGQPVLHLHHRPRVLGGLTTHEGPVTDPHKDPPYPWPISVAKVLYLFADYLIGWFVRLRPHLRGGGHVLLERGWWDLLVDPARYRLRPHRSLLQILGALLPSATTIVLLAEGEVLARRTDELGHPELVRQVAAWRALIPRLGGLEIDATAPLTDVLRRVEQTLAASDRPGANSTSGWIALPHQRSPRWFLPRSPIAAALNGLRVYTPVTPRGLAGWWLAHVLVRLGAGAILPAGAPPQQTLKALAALLPPGGTVALGYGSHPDRYVAMILDRAGSPVAFAKLVGDAPGEAALAAEAAGLRAVRPYLPESLRMPELLDAGPRCLVFEAVHWLPRARPWRLAPSVARGLGELYASGEQDGTGPAHGDCAPWNLLRARGSWYLVDWAEATSQAPVFTDLWHYVVQAHALLGRPSRRSILTGAAGRGPVGAAVRAYSEGAKVEWRGARAGLVCYLHRSWAHLDPAAEDGHRGQVARAALLADLDQDVPT